MTLESINIIRQATGLSLLAVKKIIKENPSLSVEEIISLIKNNQPKVRILINRKLK